MQPRVRPSPYGSSKRHEAPLARKLKRRPLLMFIGVLLVTVFLISIYSTSSFLSTVKNGQSSEKQNVPKWKQNLEESLHTQKQATNAQPATTDVRAVSMTTEDLTTLAKFSKEYISEDKTENDGRTDTERTRVEEVLERLANAFNDKINQDNTTDKEKSVPMFTKTHHNPDAVNARAGGKDADIGMSAVLSPHVVSSVRAVERLIRRIKQLTIQRNQSIIVDRDGAKYDYRDIVPFSLLDASAEQRALLKQNEDDEKLTQAHYEHVLRSDTYWSPIHAVRRGKGLEFSIFVSIVSFRDPFCASTVERLFKTASWPVGVFLGIVEQHSNAQTVMRELMKKSTTVSEKPKQGETVGSTTLAPHDEKDMEDEKERSQFDPTLADVDKVYDGTCIPPAFLMKTCQQSFGFCPFDNIRIRQFAPSKTRGYVYARYLSTLLYRGESYVLFLGGKTRTLQSLQLFAHSGGMHKIIKTSTTVEYQKSAPTAAADEDAATSNSLPLFFSPLASSTSLRFVSNWDRRLVLMHRQVLMKSAENSDSGNANTKVLLTAATLDGLPIAKKCAADPYRMAQRIRQQEKRSAGETGTVEQATDAADTAKVQVPAPGTVASETTYDYIAPQRNETIRVYRQRLEELLFDRLTPLRAPPIPPPLFADEKRGNQMTEEEAERAKLISAFRFFRYPDEAELYSIAADMEPECQSAFDSHEYITVTCDGTFDGSAPAADKNGGAASAFPHPLPTVVPRQSNSLTDKRYLTPIYPLNPEQVNSTLDSTLAESTPKLPYIRQPWVSSDLIFGFADVMFDVPLDPHLEFAFVNNKPEAPMRAAGGDDTTAARSSGSTVYDQHKDDVLYSARLYTHGYDVFAVTEPIAFHFYTPSPNGYEGDNKETKAAGASQQKPPSDNPFRSWDRKRARSERRALTILNKASLDTEAGTDPRATDELDRYGVGRARSLRSFYQLSGVDWTARRMTGVSQDLRREAGEAAGGANEHTWCAASPQK